MVTRQKNWEWGIIHSSIAPYLSYFVYFINEITMDIISERKFHSIESCKWNSWWKTKILGSVTSMLRPYNVDRLSTADEYSDPKRAALWKKPRLFFTYCLAWTFNRKMAKTVNIRTVDQITNMHGFDG